MRSRLSTAAANVARSVRNEIIGPLRHPGLDVEVIAVPMARNDLPFDVPANLARRAAREFPPSTVAVPVSYDMGSEMLHRMFDDVRSRESTGTLAEWYDQCERSAVKSRNEDDVRAALIACGDDIPARMRVLIGTYMADAPLEHWHEPKLLARPPFCGAYVLRNTLPQTAMVAVGLPSRAQTLLASLLVLGRHQDQARKGIHNMSIENLIPTADETAPLLQELRAAEAALFKQLTGNYRAEWSVLLEREASRGIYAALAAASPGWALSSIVIPTRSALIQTLRYAQHGVSPDSAMRLSDYDEGAARTKGAQGSVGGATGTSKRRVLMGVDPLAVTALEAAWEELVSTNRLEAVDTSIIVQQLGLGERFAMDVLRVSTPRPFDCDPTRDQRSKIAAPAELPAEKPKPLLDAE